MSERTMETPLDDRVKNLLTEARVVLPGAQALLGFQFLSVLTEAFEELPRASKTLHLASLGAVALTTVLLMAPAAYHRIVEEGEDTERFHRVGSWFLLWAMGTLALGIAGDTYVVVERVTRSSGAAAVCAIAALLMFYGLWFGYTFFRRSARSAASARRE